MDPEMTDDELLAPDRVPDDDGEAEPDDDRFELEMDGEVHVLPGALKGAFLRQSDYTRKTQELAEHRRMLAAERDAFSQEVTAHRGASADQIRLAALDHQLEDFGDVDWDLYAQQDRAGAEQAWAAYEQLQAARERLAWAVSHHAQRSELRAARDAADAMAETGRTLSREIEGWSPEVALKLVDYAQAFGVTLDELREAADPRVWKLLHKAWKADSAEAEAGLAQAREVRPAVRVSGGGAGGPSVRDELGTKEWMRRRNAQMTGGR